MEFGILLTSHPNPAEEPYPHRAVHDHDPIRVVESASFVDILSNGHLRLGIGSGYRPCEFEGLGKDFEHRRDMVEEAVGPILEAFRPPAARAAE